MFDSIDIKAQRKVCNLFNIPIFNSVLNIKKIRSE